MKLLKKTVLITGAAGRLGSAVAKKAASEGANLVLCDVAMDRLKDLEKHILDMKIGSAFALKCDITSDQDLNSLLPHAHDLCGPITSAVHCAYPVSPGWGTSFDSLNIQNLSLDLTKQLGSAIMVSQKVLSYFQKHDGGDFVHLSSIQGVRAPKFNHYEGTKMTSPIEYAAIKAGIISITRWLAKFYSNQNIRVNCVSPGGILDNQPSEFILRYRKDCSNIGMLSSGQVASSVVYLLSSESQAINGQNLIVDDGWTL